MMSLDTIRNESRRQAKRAGDENLTPYVVREGDVDDWKIGIGLPLPFPNIGDYDPPGFTKLRDLFVDASGLGQPGEPALTQAEFFNELVVDRAYAITEVGQFQLYVTEYDVAGRYQVRETVPPTYHPGPREIIYELPTGRRLKLTEGVNYEKTGEGLVVKLATLDLDARTLITRQAKREGVDLRAERTITLGVREDSAEYDWQAQPIVEYDEYGKPVGPGPFTKGGEPMTEAEAYRSILFEFLDEVQRYDKGEYDWVALPDIYMETYLKLATLEKWPRDDHRMPDWIKKMLSLKDDQVKEDSAVYRPGTNITDEVKGWFDYLVDPRANHAALLSCFVNGEPTSAIVLIKDDDPDDVRIWPVFVAVTEGMRITDHDGEATSLPSELNEDPPEYADSYEAEVAEKVDGDPSMTWAEYVTSRLRRALDDDPGLDLVAWATRYNLYPIPPPSRVIVDPSNAYRVDVAHPVANLARAMRESGIETEVMQRVDDELEAQAQRVDDQVDEDNRRRRAEAVVDDMLEDNRDLVALLHSTARGGGKSLVKQIVQARLKPVADEYHRIAQASRDIRQALQTTYPDSLGQLAGLELLTDLAYARAADRTTPTMADMLAAGIEAVDSGDADTMHDWAVRAADLLPDPPPDETPVCEVCGHELCRLDEASPWYCPNDTACNTSPGEIHETPADYSRDVDPGLALIRELRNELIAAGDWDTKRQGMYDRIVAKLYPDSGVDEVESVYVGVCAECERYYDDNDPGLNLCKTCSDWTVDGVDSTPGNDDDKYIAEPPPPCYDDTEVEYIDADLEPVDLYRRKRNGRYEVVKREKVRDAALASYRLTPGLAIKSPASTEGYLKLKYAGVPHEVFACIFLDNRHRVIEYRELFRGTIDGTSVYPREVVKEALACNAAAVILAHNHPSGVAEPSQADERITKKLRQAFETVDIRLLDHIVVGDNAMTSLANRGMI